MIENKRLIKRNVGRVALQIIGVRILGAYWRWGGKPGKHSSSISSALSGTFRPITWDAVLDLLFIRTSLAEHYSHTGRPPIDPALMIRMLLLGEHPCRGAHRHQPLMSRGVRVTRAPGA